jgi:IS30 family transposase
MSKFFTYEDRLNLQKFLKEGISFKKIAAQLGKDPSTISREVRKYAVDVATGKPGYSFNACKNRFSCKVKAPSLCGKECTRQGSSGTYCRLCRCNENCTDFVEEICAVRTHVPYVCNACPTIEKCTLLKTMYDAEKAHLKSHRVVSDSRSGISSSETEIARLNRIISPLVKQGHSIHEIYVTHQDEIMCSEKTIYNYIDDCLLDVRNIDLPRKVRFRARRKKAEFKVDKGCRLGRSYKEFETFMEKNPDTAVVQMDSVIGTIGGKCLLTIHFVESSLMLAFLRDANTSQSVLDVFEQLDTKLGGENFNLLFPVILTDNGSEFSNPKKIEYREYVIKDHGYRRTRVYYCDAGRPYQKGAIEVNHELIRRILPKGSSFDELTQDDINRMMNHINSYKRKKLNDRSPYETFSFHYGEELLRLLGCSPVAAENILLKPSLLKK